MPKIIRKQRTKREIIKDIYKQANAICDGCVNKCRQNRRSDITYCRRYERKK